MPDYPQSERLAAVADDVDTIRDFLNGGPWALCALGDSGRVNGHREAIVAWDLTDTEQALYEHFGIDGKALEAERRAMLAAVRGE